MPPVLCCVGQRERESYVEQKNKPVQLCVIISIDHLYFKIHRKAISLKKISLPISLHSSSLPLRNHGLYPSNKAHTLIDLQCLWQRVSA